MFMHNKRLMYTVRVSEPNAKLASLMLEQFGGPDRRAGRGHAVTSSRAWATTIPGRKDMLIESRPRS